MMTMGDRWTEEMVEDLLHGAPVKDGRLDYLEFTRILKHGSRDKENDDIPDIKPETDKEPEPEVETKKPPEVPPKPTKN